MTDQSIAARLTEALAEPSRVLVVDDHDLFASMMRRILEEVGMDVTLAPTGTEGLRIFQSAARDFQPSRQHRSPFDLIFIDVRLPDIPGQQVAKGIRALWPDQVLILMSGYDIEHDPDLGLIGLWFKGGRDGQMAEMMFQDIRRLCRTLGIPVTSTPL